MNLDPRETEKFDDLAAHWWEPEGPCAPLHHLNPARLSFVQAHSPLHGARVLDLGCGGGILTESLAAAGANVSGVDASAGVIKIARLHALEAELNIDYHLATIEAFANDAAHQQSFDVITCMEMLEHVPDPASILAHAAACLKPGGRLFLSTLNRNPKAYLFGIIAAEYVLRLLPRGTHDFHRFIKPSELVLSAERCGLSLIAMSGLRYNPFSRAAGLCDDMSVNYICALEKAVDA